MKLISVEDLERQYDIYVDAAHKVADKDTIKKVEEQRAVLKAFLIGMSTISITRCRDCSWRTAGGHCSHIDFFGIYRPEGEFCSYGTTEEVG